MMIRELNARKAKFGFNLGKIRLSEAIQIGKFLEALQVTFTSEHYVTEEAGYNWPEVKIYTDREDVATWIRNYPC